MLEARQPEASTYTSFLVRFWYEPEAVCWYGEVEHIQSHTRARVRNLAEVIAFLNTRSDLPPFLREQQQPDNSDG